jgi:chloramphenicol O-acetyltransferase type A
MRYVDLETWPRRDHFRVFNGWDFPHLNLCAHVDVTAFYPAVKQRGLSFTVATVYMIARAANAIPEFRYRIRGGEVVEHEVVHPATTILTGDDLFSFCWFDYIEDFSAFAAHAAERITCLRDDPTFKGNLERDDLLYTTAIPWVSFTNIMHPLEFPVDSIPRFAWGKFFEEGESLKMPLSVQAHHALVDGLHMGRYYENVQEYLSHPESALGST